MQLILSDLEMSCKQNLVDRLWRVAHYPTTENLRKQLHHTPNAGACTVFMPHCIKFIGLVPWNAYTVAAQATVLFATLGQCCYTWSALLYSCVFLYLGSVATLRQCCYTHVCSYPRAALLHSGSVATPMLPHLGSVAAPGQQCYTQVALVHLGTLLHPGSNAWYTWPALLNQGYVCTPGQRCYTRAALLHQGSVATPGHCLYYFRMFGGSTMQADVCL